MILQLWKSGLEELVPQILIFKRPQASVPLVSSTSVIP